MLRIDIGCGVKHRPGFDKYYDIMDFGYNEILDLEVDKLPLKDNSVEYAYAHHVIEHIREVKNVFNEVHRVLHRGGTFEVVVPYGLWPGAFNPSHYQIITSCWLGWFRDPDLWRRYGYKVWTIDSIKENKNKDGEIFELVAIMHPNKDLKYE